MNKILSQFIPIIILFLLLSYSKDFIDFSNTVLGKLCALLIIIYYTILDKTLGLLVCSLMILYYQSEIVENVLNMDEIMKNMFVKEEDTKIEGMENRMPKKNKVTEGMSDIDNVYVYDNLVDKSLLDFKQTFKKDNCIEGQLKYKNMNVKDEIVDHIFPEIEYAEDKCNPCADSCKYSIVENKLLKEKEMIPKFSKDEKM
tara:strand:- start:2930 stop:3529 length:600 start_codon:yes stop_codon:yes gene_type:complete